MPENGEINKQFGVYKSVCCGREVVVCEGAKFPDCPRHKNLSTIWKPVDAEIIETKSFKKAASDPAA